jgi:RNA polymerase sigma factor (TIGR02999 family)
MNGTDSVAVPGDTGVTALLEAWVSGDSEAEERLLRAVYAELRSIAARLFRRERLDHTLQPTAVVHEAFLKLIGGARLEFRDRAHFFAVAAQAMRQILVDHARARRAAKRGGAETKIEWVEDLAACAAPRIVDVIAVDDALGRLADLDRTQARVVELRYFAGLSVDETAEVLGRSAPSIKRDWRLAKAFLFRELGGDGPAGAP